MHFDTAVNWTNHFMNMENEEVLRLRRLMHESILKVEKENLETIQKGFCDQRETNSKIINQKNDSKKVPKHPSGPFSTDIRKKSASFRGVKQQLCSPKVQLSSHAEPANINCDNVCKNPQLMCQNSSIHFLNHFHSSFLSSKAQKNPQLHDLKEKYMACAVPLAPPCQKKEIIDLGQDFASHNSFACIPNNVDYHILSEDIPKKLAIQVLPSISILDRKPYNENVRIEEIAEKNYSAGDCIKTTVLPAVSEEVRNRLSSINLNSTRRDKIPASEKKSNEPAILHPKKSIFTQSSAQNDESLQSQPDKAFLKEIIKEVLQEFQHEFPLEFIKLAVDKNFSSHQNEQALTSPENDCELDSFIGNADSLANDVATMVSSNIFMKSSYTQTVHCDQHHAASNEVDVKNLIHEVMLEMQQNSLNCSPSIEEPNNAFKMEKVHKDIQVDLKHDEIIISHTSKATQASFITENETLSISKSNKTPDVNDSFTEDDFKVISNSALMKNNEVPECHRENTDATSTSDMPSKLESVLNFFYNRFCRETGELSLSTERNLSNNSLPSIRTRDVSIQFNPVSTSTKSTATSEIALMDASNQCDVLLSQKVEEKDIRHVSIQVLPESEIVLPIPAKAKVDSSVQWEQPASALRDSCVQTMECLIPSENSANTSVSSTPVSDSIFLDDMLSEGEVFLPWNLRLLSHADKSAIQSSYNTTETSDKEKDYSLSEGEVPPKCLQQLNFMQSPSYDSSSETYTEPLRYSQKASSPIQKSHFMSSQEAESLSTISHARGCHCRASSSLSEGEVRCASTSLSEGEIPFVFHKQGSTCQHVLVAPNTGSMSCIPQCESRTLHGNVLDSQNLGESSNLQENFGYSYLDFSEGEVIGRPPIPYQSTPYNSFLDTVNEEK